MGHVVATRFTLFIIELFAFHPSLTRYTFSHDLHLLQTEWPFLLPEQTSWVYLVHVQFYRASSFNKRLKTERNVAVYSWPARKPQTLTDPDEIPAKVSPSQYYKPDEQREMYTTV